LDWIASVNVEAVEFSGLDEKAAAQPVRRAAQLRKRCEKLGLKIAGYSTGAELLGPPEEQAELVRQLKGHVDIAAELGVRNMRHDVTRGPKPDGPRMTLAAVLKAVVHRSAPSPITRSPKGSKPHWKTTASTCRHPSASRT